MYKVKPRRLYVIDRALEDPRCVARMERLLAGMGRRREEVVTLAVEDLPEVIRANRWAGEVRQGGYREHHDPDIIFNTFRWASDQERAQLAEGDLFRSCLDAYDHYGLCNQHFTQSRTMAMLGGAPFHHYERRPSWDNYYVCWSLHDLHTAWGCFHRCAYCQRGGVYVIHLDLEDWLERVDGLLAEYPWQKSIRYDVEQDVLPLEPEYGACRMLVDYFARTPDRYLILFSKSANVDHLLDLDHRGRTIMLWTLTSHTVSRRYEGRTATMEQRIEAARKCQEAGYTVRFKCKPIIPIRDWRAEITDMLEQLYAAVRPDNVSLEMVFFTNVTELERTLDLDDLEPRFVEAARRAEAVHGDRWPLAEQGQRPFPFEVKHEVYRYFVRESQRLSPDTPVTLCAETKRMWAAMSDLLSHRPWNYVCNCGPQCLPGMRQLERVEGPDAERVEQAVAAGAIP